MLLIKKIKVTKFIKDILTTGISQIAVVIFSILLLNIMARALNKEYFGLFMLIRRWIAVLLPALTLNLGIGLARYVSYEKKKARFYLNISLIITFFICFFTFVISIIFAKNFSKLLFNNNDYILFVYILMIFLFMNFLHLFSYSYFRGKLNMNIANLMKVLFFGFPVLLSFLIYLFKIKGYSRVLCLYFIIYSIFGILITLYFLKGEINFRILKDKVSFNLKKSKDMLFFSLSRIPSVILNALVFSLPVFFASKRISIIAAGYMGIVVLAIRLFEVFSMPFNMIFLPKFSGLKKHEDNKNIKDYSQVVLDFIITFLPFIPVLIFGLTRFIILIWFGQKYLIVTKSVSVAILFSMFYLSFALIRGILDGLFVFPFNNIISFMGFFVILVLSLFIGSDLFGLSISFCSGLFILGVVSIFILVKKLSLSIEFILIIKSLVLCTLVFFVLEYLDRFFVNLNPGDLKNIFFSISYRIIVVFLIYIFFWRKTLWFREIKQRIGFKKEIE